MEEAHSKPRIRNIDWQRAIRELDQLPAGQAVYIGILDQSVRTHVNQGRYSYIDPKRYRSYTRRAREAGNTKAHIYLYRRDDEAGN